MNAIATPFAPGLGLALLRLSLGVVFIAHGMLKVLVFTVPGTVQYFESLGLPGFFAHLVIGGELLGGLALIAGYLTRWVAAGLAVIGFGSVLGHAANGWLFTNAGGGWEYPVLLGFATLALAFTGPGALAMDRK